MIVKAIKTRKFLPPKDNLENLLDPLIPHLKENMIVSLTSKVISICEGNCVPVEKTDRLLLTKQQSQFYLDKQPSQVIDSLYTITNHILIGGAGIDQSNGAGYFVLLPKNPLSSAQKIRQYLKKRAKIKDLGIIITDSHSIPLRKGALGISIAHFGFESLKDYRKDTDLFGRKFNFEVANLPDSLAAAAVFEMGEGDEQTPVVLISDLPKSIKFINHPYKPRAKDLKFYIDLKEDMFAPFLKTVPWKKGGSK